MVHANDNLNDMNEASDDGNQASQSKFQSIAASVGRKFDSVKKAIKNKAQAVAANAFYVSNPDLFTNEFERMAFEPEVTQKDVFTPKKNRKVVDVIMGYEKFPIMDTIRGPPSNRDIFYEEIIKENKSYLNLENKPSKEDRKENIQKIVESYQNINSLLQEKTSQTNQTYQLNNNDSVNEEKRIITYKNLEDIIPKENLTKNIEEVINQYNTNKIFSVEEKYISTKLDILEDIVTYFRDNSGALEKVRNMKYNEFPNSTESNEDNLVKRAYTVMKVLAAASVIAVAAHFGLKGPQETGYRSVLDDVVIGTEEVSDSYNAPVVQATSPTYTKTEFMNAASAQGLTGIAKLITGQDNLGPDAYARNNTLHKLAQKAGIDLYNESNEPASFEKNGINDMLTLDQAAKLHQVAQSYKASK